MGFALASAYLGRMTSRRTRRPESTHTRPKSALRLPVARQSQPPYPVLKETCFGRASER